MSSLQRIYLLLVLAPLAQCQNVSTEPTLEEKIIIAVVLGVIIGTALGFSFCFWYRYFRYGRMTSREGRFRDTYEYDKNDSKLRSKYNGYYNDFDDGYGGRDRSYDEFDRKRKSKYDEKPGKFWGKVIIVRKGEPDEPKYIPHKSPVDEPDSKALVPYDNRRVRERGNRRNDYFIDNTSNPSFEVYGGSGIYRRQIPQVINERRHITEAPVYERNIVRTTDVSPYVDRNGIRSFNVAPKIRELPMETKYVSSGPTVREIVETPINEPIQKEVVYVRSERPTQTIAEPSYVTSRVIETRPAPVSRTSEVIYSQQPESSLARSQIVREVVQEPTRTVPELIKQSRRNDPYIVYSPTRNRKVERVSSKGYSDYLARSNYLGTRSDEGGINTLYRSGKDYLGKSNWGFM